MKKAAPILSAAVMALSGTLCSCSEAEKPHTVSFFAMDTYMTASVYGNKSDADNVRETVLRLEKLLSVTDSKSEIYAANHAMGRETLLSPETYEAVSFAEKMSVRTGGALDITVYPIVREWGFTADEYHVPDEDTISELMTHTGRDKLTLTDSGIILAEGTEIDLGSIGKGYAADIVTAELTASGVTSAMLDFGGNIQVIGSKPDGSPWKIGVRDPFGDELAGTVTVTDSSVVTSGGYERCFEVDGHRYSHIIDPSDGYPAESGIASVTVIGDSGMLCDALSTAIYVMGPERASELRRCSDDFEAVIILNDGRLLITEGLEDIFVPSDNYSDVSVIPE
ncbi:MAG: FAD:protein FMN transferase [Huintestinicola sp.]